MIREIKFRVWDKADKVMCDVTYLKFSNVQYMNVGYRKNTGGKIIDENALLDESMSGTCILMQYTGMKDKNSKEIYEGDIVQRNIFGNNVVGEIVWMDIGGTGFYLKVREGSRISFYPIGRGQLDDDDGEWCNDIILGNIHDNPELLDG